MLLRLLMVGLLSLPLSAFAVSIYGERLCHEPGYSCLTVSKGDSWESLFSNEESRDLAMRVNRRELPLKRGMQIAVPDDLDEATMESLSPFPLNIPSPGRTYIRVDQSLLAFGAYDATGQLIYWGPISSGKDYCPDVNRACRTPNGYFTMQWKEGFGCTSSKYPVGKGGAPMPYCMHFKGGYALHGSYEIPGYRASHGCVRLMVKDATWLNQHFVVTGKFATRVHVVP